MHLHTHTHNVKEETQYHTISDYSVEEQKEG